MSGITLKSNKPQDVASAVGRLLHHAAQVVESTKRIPSSVEIIRTPLSVDYKMVYQEDK